MLGNPSKRHNIDSTARQKLELDYIAREMPKSIYSYLVVAMLFMLTFYGAVESKWLFTWLFGLLGICVVSYTIKLAYARREWSAGELKWWLRVIQLRYFLGGCIWGFAGWFFLLPDDPLRFSMLVFTITAIAVGAVYPALSVQRAYVIFLVPCITPLVVRFLTVGERSYILLAILFVFAVASLIRAAVTTRKYNEQRALLASSSQDKARFIAGASHDLKQPLHTLGFLLSTVEQKYRNEESASLFDSIDDALGGMNKLVDSILDISKLDAGVITASPEHVSLSPLLSRLEHRFTPPANDKGLELVVQQTDAIVFADPVLMERVLANLLDNAVNNTHRGCISIAVDTHHEKIVVSVTDTGPGIPDHLRASVFKEYVRGESSGKRTSAGLGLGLAIAQRLSELTDASLMLESEVGRGAKFLLSLKKGNKDLVAVAASTLSSWQFDQCVALNVGAAISGAEVELLEGWGIAVSALESLDGVSPAVWQQADFVFVSGEYFQQLKLQNVNQPTLVIICDADDDRYAENINKEGIVLRKPLQPARLRRALFTLQQPS